VQRGSILTLKPCNHRGLKFVSKDRQDRLTAIGRYLADASRGYDIVGLQEVWVYDDYLRIKELVQETLPYTKHWRSGVLGSGLVVLSKYPIVSTMIKRFALNGDPFKFFHGDWYVGKCCVSATIVHPTCGEIEVFNTHVSRANTLFLTPLHNLHDNQRNHLNGQLTVCLVLCE